MPDLTQDSTQTNTPLGRIVLGLSGRGEITIDMPQAVTVINEEEIERAQATTVSELFEIVPGVQAIGSLGVAGESINIRGIGESAVSDESRTFITVDGAAKFYEHYRLGSFFSDPELYRKVEVLRGPASSTLYGSGALGGVVNFETKDALDFLTDGNHVFHSRLMFGSNNNEFATSLIFVERPSEKIESMFALSYREAGNYSDGDGAEIDGSEFDAISGLLKTRLSFGNDNAQSLTISYTRWNSELDNKEYLQTGTLDFGTVDRDITDDTEAVRYENPVLGSNLIDLDVVLAYSNTQVEQSDSQPPFPFFGCTAPSLFCETNYCYKTTSLKIKNTSEFSGINYLAYITAGVQLSNQDRSASTPAGGLTFHPEGALLYKSVERHASPFPQTDLA